MWNWITPKLMKKLRHIQNFTGRVYRNRKPCGVDAKIVRELEMKMDFLHSLEAQKMRECKIVGQ